MQMSSGGKGLVNLFWAIKKAYYLGRDLVGQSLVIRAKAVILFLTVATGNLSSVAVFRAMKKSPALSHLVSCRPSTVGVFIWPYVCSDWTIDQRISALYAHCNVIDRIGFPFDFSCDEEIQMLDLGHIFPGMQIILDQPRWFVREGQFAINIHIDRFRAFSLVFNFSESDDGAIVCYVGGIQGRNVSGIQSLYKSLQKTLHGMRPRDFLIEIFRIMCRKLNVSAIYCIAGEYHCQKHTYFKEYHVSLSYNDVWNDRGGYVSELDQHFYEIPLNHKRKALTDVISKKRSLYRKRYQMLDELEHSLKSRLRELWPVKAPRST